VRTVTNPKGQQVQNEYDRAGRLTEVRFLTAAGATNEVRRFVYNRAGKLLSVTDAAGATTNTYDGSRKGETLYADGQGEKAQ